MTFVIRSRAAYARPVYPPKIVKCCLATPIIRWRVITRVLMLVACSNRRTSCSTEAAHKRYYASLTITAARSRGSNSEEEYLVLRGKRMNLDASVGTGG